MSGLGEFIRHAAARRFQWERFGCAALPIDWIAQQTGRAPNEGLPRCTTEEEVQAVIDGAGGMVALWDRQLLGLATRSRPVAGAIGIVKMPDGMELGGIVSDQRWVFLMPQGVRAMPVSPSRIMATWCANG